MRTTAAPLTDLLVNRFNRLELLTEHERGVLRLIEARPKQAWRADARLLTERSEIRAPQFVMTGWAARVRELSDSRRQIVGILLPGDAIGLAMRAHPLALSHVVALTPMRTVDAPEIAVAWRDRERVPGLAAAFDLAAAEDEYFMMSQVVRLGRQTAYERIANWFMELEYRLSSRGLSTNGSFPLPVTQETLADAVGLSVVHVNRTLQQMRKEGRIELTRGRLSLLDPDALRAAGEFHPPALSAPRQLAAEAKVVHH
ncbi:MAG TPA: Crp/Fnr family transcriptional regulator [Hyphomonadaceae bacterium]|nr:Crp/Fnr family transcriptional regulator [Hyphomonadaceae bacterium]